MRKLPIYYLNPKGTWIRIARPESFKPSKPESHVEVVETAAIKKEIEALRDVLEEVEILREDDTQLVEAALTRADKLIKELEG